MGEPVNPAVASGPGAMSQRTDGNAEKQATMYAAGIENAGDYMDLQSSAAMEKAPSVRGLSPAAMRSAVDQAQSTQSNVIPMSAGTQQPNVPVTDGADAGAGRDSSVLGGSANATVQDVAFKQQIASYMPALMFIASSPGTSPETRNVIRQLRENM